MMIIQVIVGKTEVVCMLTVCPLIRVQMQKRLES